MDAELDATAGRRPSSGFVIEIRNHPQENWAGYRAIRSFAELLLVELPAARERTQ